MKLINNLALAAVAATLLFQTSMTRADNETGDKDHSDHGAANVNFTKWVTVPNPRPGVFADMAGVIEGGDAGDGIFTGEVLTRAVDPVTGVITVEAVYHFRGSKHSFDARIHAEQKVAGIGQKGVIIGVVTDGWLKGHTVEGEWTVHPPCYPAGTGIGNCFEVTLDIIKSHSND